MSCKQAWDNEFLHANLQKTFINQSLKQHREKVLMDRQKMLLTETQLLAERELEIRDVELTQNVIYEQIGKYENKLEELKAKYARNSRKVNRWRTTYTLTNDYEASSSSSQNNSVKFVRGCPNADCRGFLNSNWSCGICKITVCKDCHVVLDDAHDAHVCNEDDVKTAKLIMKDSKPCPTCHSLIFKISGCDQMWCTQCQTAFSWRTGNIESHVHNPHYYEWIRNNNNGEIQRERGDVPCGGLVSAWFLTRVLRNKMSSSKYDELLAFHRIIHHIHMIEIPKYEDGNETNLQKIEMRIKWLLSEIEENVWKRKLQVIEKKNRAKQNKLQIFQMMYNVGLDIFQRLEQELDLHKDRCYDTMITAYLTELSEIKDYTNDCFKKISRQYNFIMPFITKVNNVYICSSQK